MNFVPYNDPNATYMDGLVVATDHRLVYTEWGTSLAKNVYNLAGDSLGNKLALNAVGYQPIQIQLGEGDYGVILQRYVAGDRDLDSSWEDVWPQAYKLVGATASTGVLGTLGIVATRAALKALPEDHGYSSVLVTGYYASGDGGGGLYDWDPSDTSNDDFGYSCELDSAPGTGRFLWALQPGQTSVNTVSYGILSGIVGTCDIRLYNAIVMANLLRIPLTLSNWPHSLSSNLDTGVDMTIPQYAYFTAPDTSSIRAVTLTGKVTVENRLNTNPLNRKDRTSIYFTPGALPGGARPEYWDFAYPGGTFADAHTLAACSDGGGTVVFTRGTTYELGTAANTFTAAFIVEPTAVLQISNYTVNIDGPITVLGSPYWQIFLPVNGGVPLITGKHTDPVEAWWFGWGSVTSTTQISNLQRGYTACSTHNHTYHITKNQYPGYVNTFISWTDTGVTLDIDDVITITTGGTFTAVNMPTDRRKYFAFDGTADGSDIVLKTGVIYPEWFGAFGNGAANDTTALTNALLCTATSSLNGTRLWLDLGSKIYYTGSTVSVTGLTWFGVRHGSITGKGISFSTCQNFRLEDFQVYSTGVVGFTASYCTNVVITDCYFSRGGEVFGSAALMTGTGGLRCRNTLFGNTVSAGGFPLDTGVDAADQIYSNCEFSSQTGLLEVYGQGILFEDCIFTMAIATLLRLGYSVTGPVTGTNNRFRRCEFYHVYMTVEGMDGMEISNCKFRGLTNSTQAYITLKPHTTAEPNDFYVAHNTFSYDTAATASFKLVDYTTLYGAYAPAVAGGLFQSMVVADNVLLQTDANWNEWSGSTSNGTGAIAADAKKAQCYKTHANWVLYFNGSTFGTYNSDGFDGYYIGEAGHTNMTWESLIANGSADYTNTAIYPKYALVNGTISIGMYGSGTLEKYWINGTTRTSARMP